MNTRQALPGGTRDVPAHQARLHAVPAEPTGAFCGKPGNPASDNTAGSPPALPCRRGLAPKDDGLSLDRRRRPRPFPARVSTNYPFTITDGVVQVCIAPCDAWVLFALMSSRVATFKILGESLWPGATKRPLAWHKALHVHVRRLRPKLRPFGWQIVNYPNVGYSLLRLNEKREALVPPKAPAGVHNSRKFCREKVGALSSQRGAPARPTSPDIVQTLLAKDRGHE